MERVTVNLKHYVSKSAHKRLTYIIKIPIYSKKCASLFFSDNLIEFQALSNELDKS